MAMLITIDDIDSIAMLRFNPIRGTIDYKKAALATEIFIKLHGDVVSSQSKEMARGICESFKTKP